MQAVPPGEECCGVNECGAAIYAYLKKPDRAAARPPTAIMTSVGVELGKREQTERLIKAVNGVTDAIRDKWQEETEDTMEELIGVLRRREGR